jgi:hypothetical protein
MWVLTVGPSGFVNQDSAKNALRDLEIYTGKKISLSAGRVTFGDKWDTQYASEPDMQWIRRVDNERTATPIIGLWLHLTNGDDWHRDQFKKAYLAHSKLETPLEAGLRASGDAARLLGREALSLVFDTPASGPVSSWTVAQKFQAAIRRAIPLLPKDIQQEVEVLLSPQALAIMGGTFAFWGISHFFGVGEVVDAILLVIGSYYLGSSAVMATEELVGFIGGSVSARSEAELDIAARHFARVVAMIGVQAVLAVLLRSRCRVGGRPSVPPAARLMERPAVFQQRRGNRVAPRNGPASGASTAVESSGARIEGRRFLKKGEHPFESEVNQPISATSKTPKSFNSSIRSDIAESSAYKEALFKHGEVGLQRPLGSNVPGPDFITAAQNPATKTWEIIINDVKMRNSARFPKPKKVRDWIKEAFDAVSEQRLNLGDPALEAQIRQAAKQGRIRFRQLNADYSPQGQGRITGW